MCQLKFIVSVIVLISFVAGLPSLKHNKGDDGQDHALLQNTLETTERDSEITDETLQLQTETKIISGRTTGIRCRPSVSTAAQLPVDSVKPEFVESVEATERNNPPMLKSTVTIDTFTDSIQHQEQENLFTQPLLVTTANLYDDSLNLNNSESTDQENDTSHVPLDQRVPAMIDIPPTYNNIQAKQSDPEFQDHPGLKAAQFAIHNKRSPKNAYLLILGLAGAGKSTTINFLFGRNVADVGKSISTKSQITEYSIDIPILNLGIQNSQLRIINTPGLGSSKGIQHDARIIASLNNYLSQHEDLSNSLPNAVLIFSKFDDNRMQGISSTFVKMLRGYNMISNSFTTTDESSNIIYVLTRFLSETKTVTRNPKERLDVFRNVIQNYTTFPKPIILCVAENEAIEEELPQIGENYQLPNKELYPQNLIDKILNISNGLGGQISIEVFKNTFEKRKNLNLTIVKSFPILDGRDEQSMETLRQIEASEFPIDSTEVSKALEEADKKIDPDLKRNHPASLQLLQRAFQTKQIKNLTQIPTKRSEIVTFLQGSNMNPAMVALFEKAFSIVIPEFQFDLVTGYGYDTMKDEFVSATPYEFEEMKFSKLGFMLPDGITAEPVNEEVNVLNFFKDTKEYMNSRIREVGLQEDINEDVYEAEFRPGYNVIDKTSKVPMIEVTSLREIRKFQLTLNERIPLNEKFINTMSEMPLFNINDRDSVNEWNSIFQEYGTHVVASAYGGGEIETTVELKNEELQILKNGETDNVKNTILNLPHNLEYSKEIENNLKDTEISIRLVGGDYKFGRLNLEEMELSEMIKNVEEWKKTLGYEAVMLKSKFLIIPLSDVVKKINSNIAIEMQKAMKALFQGTLEYIPPPTLPPTPKPYGTEADKKLLDSLSQSARNFEERLAIQRKEFEDNQKRYLAMLTTPPTKTDWGKIFRDSISTTSSPSILTHISNAKDFIWKSLRAVPEVLFPTRKKLLDLYDSVDAGNLTIDKLSMGNVKKLVDLAKEQSTLVPSRNNYPSRNGVPSSGQGTRRFDRPGGTLQVTPDNHNQDEDISVDTSDGNIEFVLKPSFKGPGYGYDLTREKLLSKTPFILNQNSLSIQPMRNGYEVSFVNFTFPNVQKYISHRSHITNAKIYISRSVFKGAILPGYAAATSNYNVVKEYREKLVTLRKLNTLIFNNEFKEVLGQLRPYNKDNCESANQWRALFNEYGTHILSSTYTGGAIQFMPYGNAKKEIHSINDISKYFENTNLDGKQFTIRTIGGNPQILSSQSTLNSLELVRWASSINDHIVVLPTDIKLIPIHQLIEIIKPINYHDSMKAFNDYFDGNLKACDIRIQCGPSRSVVNGECACPLHQKLINNHCRTLEGRGCSLDFWDVCVSNSICINTDDNYGICKCRYGFEKTSNDFCYKSFGKKCMHSIECDSDNGLACNSEKCQCVNSNQEYNFFKNMCLSTKDGPCGDFEKFGILYNLKCEDGFVCRRETQSCI